MLSRPCLQYQRVRIRAARYRFTDPYGGAEESVTGAEASAEGLRFVLAPMSSALREYRKE